MPDLHDLSDQEKSRLMEKARSNVARKRPGFGVTLLTFGLGIPLLIMISLITAAPEYFTSTLLHRLLLALLVAISTGIAITVVIRYRTSVIEREAKDILRRG